MALERYVHSPAFELAKQVCIHRENQLIACMLASRQLCGTPARPGKFRILTKVECTWIPHMRAPVPNTRPKPYTPNPLLGTYETNALVCGLMQFVSDGSQLVHTRVS